MVANDTSDRITELTEQTALSEQEARVQAFRESGYDRQEIADELDIAKSTVREYVTRIDTKRREAKSTAAVIDGEQPQASDDDGDPQLFLAPCSNDHAYTHFENTVLEGIDGTAYADAIPAPFANQDRLPIWGTGEGNATAAEAIEPGDIIAFYVGEKTYSHIAIVRATGYNEALARNIWTDKAGETWPYVIYLDDPVEVDLDSTVFHSDIGYDIDYPLGFTRVDQQRVDELRLQHGSLHEYFETARARQAFEDGEELPVDMYQGGDQPASDSNDVAETSLATLRERAEQQGSATTTTTTTTTTQHDRSAAVKTYARKRADGVCEGCGVEAPFVTKSGEPYLEVHHVFEVSDEGPDMPDAVIALCPACHRRVHYGEDGNEYNRQLIDRLSEIESELDFDNE